MKKNKLNKWIFILSTSSLFFGCAYGPQGPQNIDEIKSQIKEHRQQNNQAPTVKTIPINFEKIKAQNKLTLKNTPEGSIDKKDKLNFSNRQIYFLTLFYQYNTFKRAINFQDTPIQYCPQFHNIFLEHKNKLDNLQVSINVNNTNNEYYPELYLPIEKDEIKSENHSDQLQSKLSNHIHTIQNELQELCDYGKTQQYYIFENLTIHASKNKNFSYNTDSLNILLKNLVLFNHLLEISIFKKVKDNNYYFYHKVFNEYMKKGSIEWVALYYNEFKKSIKNQ